MGDRPGADRVGADRVGADRAQADGALVEAVRLSLAESADPARAPAMQAYMKSQLPYRGVARPIQRRTLRPVFAAHPPGDAARLEATVRELFHEAAYREEKYAAIDLLRSRVAAPLRTPERMPLIAELIVAGAWWDLVDELAGHVTADLHRRHPEQLRPVLLEWSRPDAADPDMWLRRAAIIAQLGSKAGTDTGLLTTVIDRNAGDREFFIRKAIGWALRDYARTDPQWVREFVDAREQTLSGLSRREARKHL